jgi:uracil-DNA glycosylase family 4
MSVSELLDVRKQIVACEQCPRLRAYCQQVGREKRRAYRDDIYWAKPVPGFGDPRAKLLIIGLAPAAHGANRTGRFFTGDGAGGAGDFLMTALYQAGFANIPTSRHTGDGLKLQGAFISAAVRCAPPDNKPTREELGRCLPYLNAEAQALPRVRAVVALGQIAFDAYLRMLSGQGLTQRPRPVFGHGSRYHLSTDLVLIGCYHPSRQNTNTGKLTPAMMARVFLEARKLIAEG